MKLYTSNSREIVEFTTKRSRALELYTLELIVHTTGGDSSGNLDVREQTFDAVDRPWCERAVGTPLVHAMSFKWLRVGSMLK